MSEQDYRKKYPGAGANRNQHGEGASHLEALVVQQALAQVPDVASSPWVTLLHQIWC
jgi:hypothetical protein